MGVIMKRAKEIPRTWREFVHWVAEKYAGGSAEEDVGAQIEGVEVEWEGRVRQNNCSAETAPLILVDMERVEVPLSNGLLFVGNFLSLPVRGEKEIERGRMMSQGEAIHFRAKLGDESGAFPAVTFGDAFQQKKIFLEVGLSAVNVLSRA